MFLTEEEKERIYKNVKNFSHAVDSEVIELGTVLSLRITDETIDVYKWASAEDMEADDYDFDSDYITTIYRG